MARAGFAARLIARSSPWEQPYVRVATAGLSRPMPTRACRRDTHPGQPAAPDGGERRLDLTTGPAAGGSRTSRSPTPSSHFGRWIWVQGFAKELEATLPRPDRAVTQNAPRISRVLLIPDFQRVAGAACSGDCPGGPAGPPLPHRAAPAAVGADRHAAPRRRRRGPVHEPVRGGDGDRVGRGRRWLDRCLLYTSPSPRDRQRSRMPSSA